MAKLLKLRRGSTTAHASFTGAEGEVTIDTTKDTAVVHDGAQAGGRPLAREDMNNVSSASIAGRLGTDSIAVGKIAAGTLPSDVKVTDSNVSGNLTIVNADVTSSAAIAGTKISPDFGSQNVATTGTLGCGSITTTGTLNITSTLPQIYLGDTDNNPDFGIWNHNGIFRIVDASASNATRFQIQQNGLAVASNGFEVTGNIAVSGTVDGRDVASDGSKLDGIESGATADQSASEILTLIKTVDGSGSGLDADTVDGYNVSTSDSTSTLVARNSSGYIFGNYINMNGTFSNSPNTSGMSTFTGTNGSDNYGRSYSAAAARSLLNVENGATADQTDSEIATALRGQTIGTSTNGTSDIYCDNWFRNNQSGEGMYNQGTNMHWYSDSAHYWNLGAGQTAHGIRFRDNSGGTIRGYVYANNSSQIGFLKADGNWSLKMDASGNLTATGNVTAYSDARLKTNVNTINDALSIVGKLRGVSFDWKESGKHSIGLIAQEVEEVLPELVVTQEVSTTENPETKEVKSVDYGKIVGVLINAINELKAEVDELKGGK